MKANVIFPKKAKNSFIFFQLGLIAAMLTVLFILEFNFEVKPKKIVDVTVKEPIDISIPSSFKIIPKANPVVQNIPKAQPVFTNTFKQTKQEVPVAVQKPVEPVATPVNTNTINQPVDAPVTNSAVPTNNAMPTVYNVEELPMFPACKGLQRDEQMKCFEEQMAKAVAKNAIYPEVDHENKKQGVALISFTIDEKGKIIDVKAVDNKRATPEMQKAAEKAVQQVSKIIPAKQGGVPVTVKYTIPVAFRIQ